MNTSEIIGKNIKEARKFSGLTQKNVALKLFMTQQQYSRFENGKFELNYEQILKLCELYNVTPNDIFDIKNKKFENILKLFIFINYN